MRTVLLCLFLAASSIVTAQSAIDSIRVYEYPVRQGVIYKYDPRENFSQACASNLCIVSVVTPADSVFHFEAGEVSSVFTVGNNYGIVVINPKGESITYSNLKDVRLKKGDHVKRGMLVGTTAQGDSLSAGLKLLDILILRNIKALPYNKTVQYIKSNMSTGRKPTYSTL